MHAAFAIVEDCPEQGGAITAAQADVVEIDLGHWSDRQANSLALHLTEN
jgi:hypothetical protein